MKRRDLLLVAAAAACATPPPRRPFAEGALKVARAAASLDEAGENFYWRELERLTALARPRVTDGAAAAALGALLFQERGFAREVDDTDLRFVLLPRVLRDRRGSCVGLGSMYLALAEALGIAAYGVLRPGHFFVRLAHGGSIDNVELLRRGEIMPDEWYEERFPLPREAGNEYGRPLTLEETLGVIEYNVGNERRRERRYDAARSAYARAVRHFPTFADAHASLGTALHLLDRVDEARVSYHAARRLNPRLPYLDHNLSVLEAEASPRPTPVPSR